MGRKKLSMSEKVRRYLAKHPDAKAQNVAAELGVKVSLVYAVKYKKSRLKGEPVDMDAVYKAKPHEDVTPLAHNPADDWKTVSVGVSKASAVTVKPQADMVNHPPHYTAGGIETIDFLQAKLTREEFIGYLKGNALKYASRIGKKGEADIDAGKMAWYATKLRDVLNAKA